MKNFKLSLMALLVVALSSCHPGNQDPTFRLSDLQGYWQRVNSQEYVRFTEEQSDENPYLYGYEWDEGDEVYESDRFSYRVDTIWTIDTVASDTTFALDSVLLHGNGWFKYWFETTGDLHELHLMDNDGAVIPKEYIVSILTASDLEYYERDNKSRVTHFQKVVINHNGD